MGQRGAGDTKIFCLFRSLVATVLIGMACKGNAINVVLNEEKLADKIGKRKMERRKGIRPFSVVWRTTAQAIYQRLKMVADDRLERSTYRLSTDCSEPTVS